MRSAEFILATILQAAGQGAPLYPGSESGETYTTRLRAFAYTAVVTALTVFALVMGGTIDYALTIMLYVHLAVLIILLVLFGVIAATRYRPGEGALLTITLLDALAFAFYGYTMTVRFFTLLTGLWLTIAAFIVAFGCILVLVVGFALLAR
jgi:hypothetical protein